METQQTQRNFKAGDIVMRQGEPGTCAYVIEKGRVEILIEKANGLIQRVGSRGPGTIIGEMALVDNEPRVATVKVLEDCTMLEITREDFNRRLTGTDPVMHAIMQVILTRYRDMLTRTAILRESSGYPSTPEELEREQVGQTNAVETIKIANEFREAMEQGQLSLNYQPIINLGNGQVDGFEALMRWNHPEKGFISPGIFIPVAEESGLIVDASRWALREACKALKRIEGRLGYDRDLFMSVNFSSTDFAEENFLEQLYNIMSATDVDPHKIHLEITERLLMNQPENAKETLTMCRKAGMGVAIDDFGTGYSSLSYLHYYPIDTLKIDQTFIRNMHEDETALELVKTIIALGQNMRMKTIAEGVEEQAEALKLKEMGCDCAQGYYFSKPLAEDDVIGLLAEWDEKQVLRIAN